MNDTDMYSVIHDYGYIIRSIRFNRLHHFRVGRTTSVGRVTGRVVLTTVVVVVVE